MAGRAQPESLDNIIARSREIIRLFDGQVVSDTVEKRSRGVECAAFRKFTLYVKLESTGSGAHILQLVPQFYDPTTETWYDHLEGIYASLFFEDTVHATERTYVFTGDCVGRTFRLKAVGTSTTGSLYFTLTAAVEFYN